MSHIKTAYDIGVQKALKEAGYESVEDVQKQAEALGLLDRPQPNPTDGLLAALGKR